MAVRLPRRQSGLHLNPSCGFLHALNISVRYTFLILIMQIIKKIEQIFVFIFDFVVFQYFQTFFPERFIFVMGFLI
jgi:hypothetical protein